MPEGDSVHLLATRLRPSLVDRVVVDGELRSGGRAGESLAGRRIVEVDTHGKHLLTRFDDATTLHTHLRMQGSWTLTRPGRVLPSRLQRQVRVRARLDDGHTLWGVDLLSKNLEIKARSWPCPICQWRYGGEVARGSHFFSESFPLSREEVEFEDLCQ
jgi:formamidopyrimidine-DNA glycosylase